MRLRRIVPAIGALLVLPLVGTAALADSDGPPTSCEIGKLPVPNPADLSGVMDGSPSGRYHVGWNLPKNDDGNQMLLWDNGEVSVLHLGDMSSGTAYGVNDDGTIVGNADNADYIRKPIVHVNGTTTWLPGLTDTQGGTASAISPSGDVAGTVDTGTNEFGVYPMRWNLRADGTYEAEPLRMPDGTTHVDVQGIADDGTVVGMDHTRPVHYLWAWTPDGKRHELSVPAGTVGAPTISGTMAAADVTHADGNWTYLWDLSDTNAEPAKISDLIGHVTDVNAKGWIVGATQIGRSDPVFASLDGGDLRLPTLTGGKTDDEGADALSADGTLIVGASQDENGIARAVRWTCS